MAYQRMTMNLVGAKTRREVLEGREYLVIPAVMLNEGVHTGSKGPILYRAAEMKKNPHTWNHRPVVIDHPTLNGEGISACDPKVVEQQRVGLLFNTLYEDKLKTEVWADEAKFRRLAPDVMKKIDKGTSVEVSTGLFHDEGPAGVWNNESYDMEVINIQSDHLAILTKDKGACSLDKGGGLLVNADMNVSMQDIREQVCALLKGDKGSDGYPYYCYVCDVYSKFVVYEKDGKYYQVNYKVKEGKVSLTGDHTEVLRVTNYVTANSVLTTNDVPGAQMDEEMKRQQVRQALASKFAGTVSVDQQKDAMVLDVRKDFVVYQLLDKTFRLSYTQEGTTVNFTGDPQEVMVTTEYVVPPVIQGTPSTNQEPIPMTQNVMHPGAVQMFQTQGVGDPNNQVRKAVVSELITKHGWTEGDRTFLEALPDAQFVRVTQVSKATQRPHRHPHRLRSSSRLRWAPPPLPAAPASIPVGNAQLQQVINSISDPETAEFLQDAIAAARSEKEQLVKVIVANSHGKYRFSEPWLMLQNKNLLRGMASLIPQQQSGQVVRNFSGQGDVPMFTENAAFVDNDSTEQQALPIPSLWAPKPAQSA